MARQAQVIDVVVASPGDVTAERRALDRVVDELNRAVAQQKGMTLRVQKSEYVGPGFHREGRQGVIDNRLQIPECTVFVGIFWKRFGTPVPGAQSGTEHEFKQAYEAWKHVGRPKILFYFKERPYNPTSRKELQQWNKVLKFREKFPKEGLWWGFKSTVEFERLVRAHLTEVLMDLPSEVVEHPESASPVGPQGNQKESLRDAEWWEQKQNELNRQMSERPSKGTAADAEQESLRLLVRFRGADRYGLLPVLRFQCQTMNVDEEGNILCGEGPTFWVRLGESYPGAFRATSRDHAEATRLVLRLSNVPNGVRLAVPTLVETTDSAICLLTDADEAGNGGVRIYRSGLQEVMIMGGKGRAVYEVLLANPTRLNQVEVGVVAAWRANVANDLPAIGTMKAEVSLAPAQEEDWAGRTILTIARCSSVLLFPFVTNQGGFDTGITISNTSRDVFGTIAEAGACTLYYFGSTTGGGPGPPQQTTTVVPAGGQLIFTLSGGHAGQYVAATPGFQGYIIVLCQFQHASGFAMITDGFGGVPQIATGYLAQAIGAFPGGRKRC